MRTREKVLSEIKTNPDAHRHDYQNLVICCTFDGALDTGLWEAHNSTLGRTNGGINCDVLEGPCACGAWH